MYAVLRDFNNKLEIFSQMPGPGVVVCQGDTVMVEVINKLVTETTSVHFHGEHMKNHQYMDGAPHITQCPILPSARKDN
jgi:L-ascorbate oxidase